eukprot:TRINITY_DN719_c0_g1_i1.p1 TRINITY_DN719_c0_g1~~TRINITY_DN719_c0_g1_i1.p1  ORF type:complete len:595 (+),score=122.55 TRINITY_DN719_c0_g1_i1:311-2095(+)
MKGLERRVCILLSLLIPVVFIGVPVWNQLLRIDSHGIPHDRITSLFKNPSVVRDFSFPTTLSLVILSSSEQQQQHDDWLHDHTLTCQSLFTAKQRDGSKLRLGPQARRLFDPSMQCFVKHLALSSSDLLELSSMTRQETDSFLLHKTDNGEGDVGSYTMFFLGVGDAEGGKGRKGEEAVLGQYRHGWVWLSDLSTDRIVSTGLPAIRDLVMDYLVKEEDSSRDTQPLRFEGDVTVATEPDLMLTPSSRYQVTFSLISSDPHESFSWNFENTFSASIERMTQRLLPLAQVTVDSQIRVGAAGGLEQHVTRSSKHGGVYAIDPASLSSILNLNEWNADFLSPGSESLHFIAMVPPRQLSPLVFTPQLLVERHNTTTPHLSAISIPGLGGICIVNRVDGDDHNDDEVAAKALDQAMALFVDQLREFLGVPLSAPSTNLASSLPLMRLISPDHAVTLWEVDAVARLFVAHHLRSTRSTLQALSKLLQKLSSMVVRESVNTLVEDSLEAFEKAIESFRLGNSTDILRHSISSADSARSAFFHPTVLPLLYLPDEHTIVMYTSLFVPVLATLLTQAKQIYKKWKARRQLTTALSSSVSSD